MITTKTTYGVKCDRCYRVLADDIPSANQAFGVAVDKCKILWSPDQRHWTCVCMDCNAALQLIREAQEARKGGAA